MDDDLFGPSVWGTTNPSSVVSSPQKEKFPSFQPPPSSQDNHFEDFDEFGPPTDAVAVDGQDDDFGDFGDFGDVQEQDNETLFSPKIPFAESSRVLHPSSDDWEPLQLDPRPTREELQRQIDNILAPLWANDDLSQVMTDEDIRQVDGLNQILVTPESREFYDQLFNTPPPAQLPNWRRSETRRRHLIALGMPINLDERGNGKALPPLQITTRPMSAPPGPRAGVHSNAPSPSGSRAGTPRSGTPQPGTRDRPSTVSQLGIGPKPQLDQTKIDALLDSDLESMTLMPLAKLESHLAELRTQTANASSMLTYLLQSRDALQQDSETYNSLIAELVSEAQKMKTTKGKPVRRGSGMM